MVRISPRFMCARSVVHATTTATPERNDMSAELKLPPDIERMSVRELRESLHWERSERERLNKRLQKLIDSVCHSIDTLRVGL